MLMELTQACSPYRSKHRMRTQKRNVNDGCAHSVRLAHGQGDCVGFKIVVVKVFQPRVSITLNVALVFTPRTQGSETCHRPRWKAFTNTSAGQTMCRRKCCSSNSQLVQQLIYDLAPRHILQPLSFCAGPVKDANVILENTNQSIL